MGAKFRADCIPVIALVLLQLFIGAVPAAHFHDRSAAASGSGLLIERSLHTEKSHGCSLCALAAQYVPLGHVAQTFESPRAIPGAPLHTHIVPGSGEIPLAALPRAPPA